MGKTGRTERPLHLALYSGVCVRHDAISNSLRLKLDIVDRWRAAGAAITATGFVHASDCEQERIRVVETVVDLLRHPEFSAADVHIFEFGIYYPLFDAVFLLPADAASAAVYHNITPPEFADNLDGRATLERSILQRHNLGRVDLIATDSEYSRSELESLGFPAERISVLPLPSALPPAGRRPSRAGSAGPVELLYVGRFVRAKGVFDLLDAVASLARRPDLPAFKLTMAGNPQLSSPDVLAELERLSSDWGLSDLVRTVVAPTDSELAELYASADVFVIPSYHEGYCVPVIEALEAGCQVVAYDSSNLPFVVGGLGPLVATGDVPGLASALSDTIRSLRPAPGQPRLVPTMHGRVNEGRWHAAVRRHLHGHTLSNYEARLAELLRRLTELRPEPVGAELVTG